MVGCQPVTLDLRDSHGTNTEMRSVGRSTCERNGHTCFAKAERSALWGAPVCPPGNGRSADACEAPGAPASGALCCDQSPCEIEAGRCMRPSAMPNCERLGGVVNEMLA